jgi:Protein kinase domain
MNGVQIRYLSPLMRGQATAPRHGHDRAARLRAAASARVSINEPHLLGARISARSEGGGRLALERLDAPELTAVLRRRGQLGPKAAVMVIAGLARAVTALERAGLVARDLAPGNVLLDPERGAVLVDFGIPPELVPLDRPDPDPEAAFRAPEEREGGRPTPRASVYSLGAILFAALTAETPPERLSAAQERRGRDLPPTLESVVARAMSVDPARRYTDAIEMARAAVDAVRANERLGRVREGQRSNAEKPVRVLRWRRPAAVSEDAEAERRAAETARKAEEAEERKAAETARKAEEAEERKAAETARKSQEAAERDAAERDAAERDRKAVEAAEREQRAAGRAAAERAERERLLAERAERKAAKRAGRRRQAEQATERRAAQAAERKRARAAARRMRGERDGHRTAGSEHPTMPKAVPERRGRSHRTTERTQPRRRVRQVTAPKGSRVRGATAAAAIAVLVAGATAAVLAPGGGGDAEAAPTRIQAGDLTVLLPAGWEQTRPGAARLGQLTDRTVAISPERDVRLTTAVMRDPGKTVARLRGLASGASTPAPARVGRVEFARYGDVRTRPRSTGVAYVLNTTGPSVLALCEARGDARVRALRECAAAAATARLTGETALTLEAAAKRRSAARGALADLGAARMADRKRIALAVTGEQLTDASLDLQVSYYEASRGIQATRLPGIAARRLVAALARAGDAYGVLADAVIEGDQVAYDTARAGVLDTEARVWKLLPPRMVRLFADQP